MQMHAAGERPLAAGTPIFVDGFGAKKTSFPLRRVNSAVGVQVKSESDVEEINK